MRITLVHAGAFGDTVLLAPLLRSLRQRWSGATRTVVTRWEFGQMLLRLDLAENCADANSPLHSRWFAPITVATNRVLSPPGRIPETVAPAWADCDLLISAVSNGHDVWAGNAHHFSTAGEILFFQPRPPPDFSHSVPEFHRQQLASLALPLSHMPPFHCHATGPIIIASGAGGRGKCRPLDEFIALGRLLGKKGRNVRFLLGPTELERFSVSHMQAIGREFPIDKCEELMRLMDLLQSAGGFIGNDSGPGHLAAAMGLPTLVFFSGGNPAQWAPIGPRVQAVAVSAMVANADDRQNQITRLLAMGCGV